LPFRTRSKLVSLDTDERQVSGGQSGTCCGSTRPQPDLPDAREIRVAWAPRAAGFRRGIRPRR
jgi:hypothetical protein